MEYDNAEKLCFLRYMLNDSDYCRGCKMAMADKWLKTVLAREGPEQARTALDRIDRRIARDVAPSPSPELLLQQLENSVEFARLLGDVEKALVAPLAPFTASQGVELAAKFRYMCKGRYTFEDLYLGRRIREFVTAIIDYLIQSAYSYLGRACRCHYNRPYIWKTRAASRSATMDRDFIDLVIYTVKSQMDEAVADALGEVPLPQDLCRPLAAQLPSGGREWCSPTAQVGRRARLFSLYDIAPAISEAVDDHWRSREVQARLEELVTVGGCMYEQQRLALLERTPPPPAYSEEDPNGSSEAAASMP